MKSCFRPIEAGGDFTIGDIEFEPLHISHDAADPVAYRFKNENHAMAVVTDLGTYDDALVSKLQNLDGLLLEANHDINMLQTGHIRIRSSAESWVTADICRMREAGSCYASFFMINLAQ